MRKARCDIKFEKANIGICGCKGGGSTSSYGKPENGRLFPLLPNQDSV